MGVGKPSLNTQEKKHFVPAVEENMTQRLLEIFMGENFTRGAAS